MDFEGEEIFDESVIDTDIETTDNWETNVDSEKEELEAIIRKATKRLNSLNDTETYDSNNVDFDGSIDNVNTSDYFENEQLESIIKIATRRLNNLKEAGTITEPEGYAEAGELASIIKDAAAKLSGDTTGTIDDIIVGEDEVPGTYSDLYKTVGEDVISGTYSDLNETEPSESVITDYKTEYPNDTNCTTVGKTTTTSNTSFKTNDYVFTVDGDYDNKKVEIFPKENVATFGKDEWGKLFVKAKHPGNCTFTIVSENDSCITTNNVCVDVLGDTESC